MESISDLKWQSDLCKVFCTKPATGDYAIFAQGTLRNAVRTRPFSWGYPYECHNGYERHDGHNSYGGYDNYDG